MSLSKLTYEDYVTVIPASNLNDIQDEIITNASDIYNLETSVSAIEADGAIGTSNLATGAVTTIKIANGAVTSEKIGEGSVQTVNIAGGAVSEAKLANNAVTPAKLGTGVSNYSIVDTNGVVAIKLKANSSSASTTDIASVYDTDEIDALVADIITETQIDALFTE